MKKKYYLHLVIGALVFVNAVTPVVAEEVYRVKPTDNLNKIVKKFYADSALTKKQILVGILERNPRAFKNGNINSLMKGRRLVLPEEDSLHIITEDYASEILSLKPKRKSRATSKKKKRKTTTAPKKSRTSKAKSAGNFSSLEKKQSKQTKQINQLKEESEALKKRLEELVVEKKERDDKLIALEESLNNSILKIKRKQDRVENPDLSSKFEKKVNHNAQRLRDENAALQQQLQKSKSELAENNNSTVALQRRLDNLQEQDTHNIVTKTNSGLSNTGGADLQQENSLFSKYLWPLVAFLLLGLIWVLWRKKKSNVYTDGNDFKLSDEFEVPDPSVNTRVNESFEQDSLETSIQLDMAKAYIDSGDISSARGVLQEVIQAGSVNQKKEAERILAGL